jgi:hypothetical protein
LRTKRSKKFDNFVCAGVTATDPKLIKVFCFFFSKKKFLLAFFDWKTGSPRRAPDDGVFTG